jgi:hypothetical protein
MWRRYSTREREANERRRRRAIRWQREMYYLTRPTGGRLDLGVITREHGWQIPPESFEVLRRAGTFD